MKLELLQKRYLKKAKMREWSDEGGVRVGFNIIQKGDLTIKLAVTWGFCYGVLYAIEAVAEALDKYRGRKVYVLGDLIHNPYVNNELQRRGAIFIELEEVGRIGPDDVAVVPAFGTKKDIFDLLRTKNLLTVDTTCPEVRAVEHEVTDFNQQGCTAVIHGKYEHQESIATSSFADHYLIVRDKAEAAMVCDFIRGRLGRDEILKRFKRASSSGFDPDVHLRKIGMANQTTMLMNESVEIFKMFEAAVRERDGNIDNFKAIKTICSATQDRQDAMIHLSKDGGVDLFLVVGGHRSSNTKNLAITAADNSGIPAYHIEDRDSFDRDSITYLPNDATEEQSRSDWLPAGPVTIGLTAGASTPHDLLEKVIEKLLGYY